MIEIRYRTRYCRLSEFSLYACCRAVLLLSSGLTHFYGLKCEKSNINYITLPFRKPRRAFKLNYGYIYCLPLVWLTLLMYAQETFKYIITLAYQWTFIATSHNEEFGNFYHSSSIIHFLCFRLHLILFFIAAQRGMSELWEGKKWM